MLLFQGQAYHQQFGLNVIHLIPVNLYGPGDHCDPASSRVIPALIRSAWTPREAGAPHIEVWGKSSASRGRRLQVIYLSSDHVYAPPASGDRVTEHHATEPRSVHAHKARSGGGRGGSV